ncbi:MAG: hypothetical protein ACPGU7_00850 [Gammaproteobacteria bacterium]
MYVILASAGLASIFGMVATAVIGIENTSSHPWIDTIFWSLMGAGVLFEFIDGFIRCSLCRRLISKHPSAPGWLCRNNHCSTPV